MKRLAVVLYNLGGPDSLQAVEPFLFNLFMDPAIIGVPQPFRWLLAKLISRRRRVFAQNIYRLIGGRSPLLDLTNQQAEALQLVLQNSLPGIEVKVFVCMRYWHPMSDEVAQQVKHFGPDQVVMLPLYPQFSTTTTESSFADWERAAGSAGIVAQSAKISCYPTEPGFISAQSWLLKKALLQAAEHADNQTGSQSIRVLFSAHGLPKKIVEQKSDPYPEHIEQSVVGIVNRLKAENIILDDWLICYQSRVGPLEWIGPATDDEIRRAGKDHKAVVIVPIAFVSEHSETLVELDIEYKEVADQAGVTTYVRVPAVGCHEDFISGLANLVEKELSQKTGSDLENS